MRFLLVSPVFQSPGSAPLPRGQQSLIDRVFGLAKAIRSAGHAADILVPPQPDTASITWARRLFSATGVTRSESVPVTYFDHRMSSGVDVTQVSFALTSKSTPSFWGVFGQGVRGWVEASLNQPDVVIGFGWQSALAMRELRQLNDTLPIGDARGADFPIAFSLGDLSESAVIAPSELDQINLSVAERDADGSISLLELAANCADVIYIPRRSEHAVDGTIAAPILGKHRDRWISVPDGLDGVTWNPATDPLIDTRYDFTDFVPDITAPSSLGKHRARTALESGLGWPDSLRVPLVVANIRLGDPITQSLGKIVRQDLRLVVLADPELKADPEITDLVARYSDRMALLERSEKNLHRALAASDFWLSTPQGDPLFTEARIAQRYVSIPIGLDEGAFSDAVVSIDHTFSSGTGIAVATDTPADWAAAVLTAVALFEDRSKFERTRSRLGRLEQTWDRSFRQLMARIPFRAPVPASA